MSERYGLCNSCLGLDSHCFMCGGTGFSGSATLYLESEAKKEWDSNLQKVASMVGETSQRFQRIEDEFYKVVKKTEALEKAIQAMENYIKERKK